MYFSWFMKFKISGISEESLEALKIMLKIGCFKLLWKFMGGDGSLVDFSPLFDDDFEPIFSKTLTLLLKLPSVGSIFPKAPTFLTKISKEISIISKLSKYKSFKINFSVFNLAEG